MRQATNLTSLGSDFMNNLGNMGAFTNAEVDHTKLRPGLYLARFSAFNVNTTTTLDLRFITPNSELDPPATMAGLHTIEHLGDFFLRNHSELRNELIEFGPNGSRTGFRAVFFGNHSMPFYHKTFVEMAQFILDWNDLIPGATPEECGNYRDHNLLAAKSIMKKWLTVLTSHSLDYNPFRYPD